MARQDDEVYWQVGSSATLDTGTVFAGNILALASITLNTNATLICGRALALNGAVTMDSNIVSTSCGSISGTKFNDLNGDGILQTGEPGLAGVTLFLDTNNNGVLDPGEVSTTSDANGNYTFANLLPGTYRVREVLPAGFIQSSANPADITISGDQDVTGVNIGDFQPVSISGLKFNDLNGNGVRDPGEPGLAGITVFLDTNNNGVLDPGEMSTTTDANGNYTFTNLGPGTYRVRELEPAGSTQTTANPPNIAASSGTNVSGVLFGNFQLVSISGLKFNDLNGNGVRDPGEPGLAGITVFLDTNNNGVLDPGELSTTTGTNGNFTFANLPPGTYRVREVEPAGSMQTTANPADIVASSGTDVSGVLFGNFQQISISGVKFNDLNDNGVRDPGEPGLAGVTVFLDTNNNGVLDPGELSTTSDVNGNFTFANLGPGTYRVREVAPPGSTQTTPNPANIVASSGTDVSGVLIGNSQPSSISGVKFNDLNGNGVRDPGEPGLAGITVFLDTNGNGVLDPGEVSTTTDANGNFVFANLLPGTYLVREAQQAGLLQTSANPAAITINSGQSVGGVSFGDFVLTSISGVKFNDLNGNGVRDSGEPGLAGITVFLDTNNNGILDPGELSTTTDVNGNFTFTNLGPGTYRVREVEPAGSVQTTANPADIVASSGDDVSGVLFGNFQLVSISGLKFNDLNDNGVRDPGEPGLAGITVFLDTNNNGVLDPGELSTTTDTNGNYTFANLPPGTYRVREVEPAGSTQTTANPADIVASSGTDVSGVLFGNFQQISPLNSISGLKFNDLNGNGVRDPGEPGLAGITVFLDSNGNGVLDPGELSTTTDANGNYTFTNLAPGTYRVREVEPAGSMQTTGNPADIVVSSGSSITGVNFGNFQLVSISGLKFNDLNGNGVRDPGEPGLAGITVFLDTNGNGVLDPGEVSTTTDANGNFTFTNLAPGMYRVREVEPAGSMQTTVNPADIVVSSGTDVSGVLFGNFQLVSISGLKFNDLNGNGVRDPGEPGLAGITVFLDTNDNGVLDPGELSTTTDINGNYTFANLPPGTYRVREVEPAGSTQTTANPADIVASSGTDVSGVDFGNFQLIRAAEFDQRAQVQRPQRQRRPRPWGTRIGRHHRLLGHQR